MAHPKFAGWLKEGSCIAEIWHPFYSWCLHWFKKCYATHVRLAIYGEIFNLHIKTIERYIYAYIEHFLVFIALPTWFLVLHFDVAANISAIYWHC